MVANADQSVTHIVTDHDKIQILAERHDAAPVETERGDEGFRIEEAPDDADERATWERFFDWFEDADRVVRYRPPDEGERERADFELLGRRGGTESGPSADRAAEPAGDTESLATSDTGDFEPPVQDPGENEPVAPEAPDDPSTASTSDAARAPTDAADDLVLDEIHEDHADVGDDLADEYLVFQNEGDERIDLSGWTVRNDGGRSYEFPEGTVIGPGDRLTLHSGTGTDSDRERYWGAEEPVWGERGNTVLVETPSGERALRVPFEG